MSLIGTNIKKIRRVKGLNQTAFANLFGLTRANIGSYEEQRAEPKLDVILKISKFYKIEIGKLVTKELTVNEISNFNLVEKVIAKKVLTGTEILFINKKSLQTYPKEKNGKSYIESLSTINLPFIDAKKELIAIYNEGNELYFNNNGFLNGDILFLEKQEINKLKNLFLGVVVNDKKIAKGFVEIDKNSIKIIPPNPNFEPIEIGLNKKVAFWKIIGCYTENVLNNEFLVTKINKLEKNNFIFSQLLFFHLYTQCN